MRRKNGCDGTPRLNWQITLGDRQPPSPLSPCHTRALCSCQDVFPIAVRSPVIPRGDCECLTQGKSTGQSIVPSRTRLKIELEIDIDRSKRWWIWLAMNSSVLHRPITFPTCLLLPGVKLGTWQGPVRSMVPSGSFALRLVFRFAKPLNVRCSGEFEISATPDPKLDLFLSLFLNPAKPRLAGLLQLAPNGRNHPANHNGGLGSQSCPATP